jgi:hypothetical protein
MVGININKFHVKNLILGIFLILSLNFQSLAQEVKFQGFDVNFLNNQYPIFSKKNYANVEEFRYGNNFYFQTKDQKLVRMLETFIFDNEGQFESRFRSLVKKIYFKPQSTHGCNFSPKKIYQQSINNELRMNCFSVQILENIDQIYGPNFGSVEYLDLNLRKRNIKTFINKNNLEIPNQKIRTEHYFYKSGKIMWVFLTSFENDLINKDELDQYISLRINNHKYLENNLKFRKFDKINFEN